MRNPLLQVDLRSITDSNSFHSFFANALGFPGFYGRNMDAWVDCMSCLDDPDAGMTSIHVPPGSVLVLHLEGTGDFQRRCPDLYAALIECSSFVNWRRVEQGDDPVLALSFYS